MARVRPAGEHLIWAGALLLLLLFDPIVLYTAGKTWNHEVPSLLLVLAVLFHVESARRDSLVYISLSGFIAALAVGIRLTFLPCLLPLFGLIFLFPGSMNRRAKLAFAFLGAAIIASLPSIYFLATAREAFLFGNLEFPRLRLLDPENTRIQKTMTPWRKLRYFAKEIVVPSWPIFVAFAAVTVPGIRRRFGLLTPGRSGLRVVAWTAAFLVLGCCLPSRYQYQHFFALIPLLALGISLSTAEEGRARTSSLVPGVLLIGLALASMFFAVRNRQRNDAFPRWADVFHREAWFSSKAQEFGNELRSLVPVGRILTLAPTWPMAGGLQIYPEFATGPFAWRSARFVAPDRRRKFHLVAPEDLPAFLDRDPPSGILTGVEDENLEAPLVEYARAHSFSATRLSRDRVLWRP